MVNFGVENTNLFIDNYSSDSRGQFVIEFSKQIESDMSQEITLDKLQRVLVHSINNVISNYLVKTQLSLIKNEITKEEFCKNVSQLKNNLTRFVNFQLFMMADNARLTIAIYSLEDGEIKLLIENILKSLYDAIDNATAGEC